MNSPQLIASFPPGTKVKLTNTGTIIVIEPDCPLKIGELEMVDGNFQINWEVIACHKPAVGTLVEWEYHE